MLLTTVHPDKSLQQQLVLMLFVHAIILDRINRIFKIIKTKAWNGKSSPPAKGDLPRSGEGD
jgi:hypothetical protein